MKSDCSYSHIRVAPQASALVRRYEIRQLQAFRAAGKIHETAAQLEKLRAEQQQSVEIGAVDLVVVTIAQRPDNTVRAMGRAGRIDL